MPVKLGFPASLFSLPLYMLFHNALKLIAHESLELRDENVAQKKEPGQEEHPERGAGRGAGELSYPLPPGLI